MTKEEELNERLTAVEDCLVKVILAAIHTIPNDNEMWKEVQWAYFHLAESFKKFEKQ